MRRRVALRALAGVAFWCGPATATEYNLSSGDVLDFSVAGAPDLHLRAPVGLDGSVSLPLIGEVAAAGRPVSEVRADVRARVARKEFRQRSTSSTRVEADAIGPEEVTLSVAEYRPVYLNGDVAKPGAFKFEPGLTIRQALSLAGGYDILRFRMENPFLEAADLRGAYESAWIDFAREQARLGRVRIELRPDGKTDAKADAKPDAADADAPLPVSPAVLTQIRDVETKTLRLRQEDDRKQRGHLGSLLAQNDVNIATLLRRFDAEDNGTKSDEEELRRVEELYKKGTLPMTRVVETRRVALLSATQALQSSVALERAKTERETTRRQLESLDDRRRMELLQMQQDAQTKLATLRSRIQAIGEKLLYTGALKTQLARGTGGRPDLVLFRGGRAGIPVSEDAALQPGDVVEVALRIENATGGVSLGQ